jgi:hypothetical protein
VGPEAARDVSDAAADRVRTLLAGIATDTSVLRGIVDALASRTA